MVRSDLILDEEFSGHRISSLSSDIHCMPMHQTVAWQKNDSRQHYFAIGQSSGKSVLAK